MVPLNQATMRRRAILRGFQVLDHGRLMTASFRVLGDTARVYDLGPESRELFHLATFLLQYPVTREDALAFRLDIPGDIAYRALTQVDSFDPDFSSDWRHKGVVATYLVMRT